jgi:hypothetical protein
MRLPCAVHHGGGGCCAGAAGIDAGVGERENTRLEHRRQICRETGWRDHADGAAELARWLDRRTWN